MSHTLPYRALPPPGTMPGDVTLEVRRGRLLIRFSGEVDTALRPQFARVLGAVRAVGEPVEVDCREVTFFCAEGVRMLMLLRTACGGPGVVEMRSCAAVDRTLELSGIEGYPQPG